MAAVFTSIGYPGTIEPGATWARTKQTAGGTYGVVGAGDWKVTIKPAADRTASIAAGSGFGGGIDDTTVGVGEVTFGTLTSGTRYDMVVARRTWGGTNATSFVVIAGSSTRGLPARSTTPGTQDDQPLALARIAGGVGGGVLAEIIPLRCWQSNGGAVGEDDLVRSYLTDIGTEIWIGSALWHRYTDALGSAAWEKVDPRYVLRSALNVAAPTAAPGFAPFIQAKPVGAATGAGALTGVIDILFDEPFAAPPIVTATTVSGTSVPVVVASDMVTATGCRLYWAGLASTAVKAHVIAVGWRP